MKLYLSLIICLLFQFAQAQDLLFSNLELKSYLLTYKSIDLNGDEQADAFIDVNNDQEIQLSEALLVEYMVIVDQQLDTLFSLNDLHLFSNMKKLSVFGGQLTEVSNLNLDSLEFIRISDIQDMDNIDLSDLHGLKSIVLESLYRLKNLNLQNGSFASEYFSLFYTDIKYACVDSISEEYNNVSYHMVNGATPTLNCSIGIPQNKELKAKFYPNPVSNRLMLSTELKNYKVDVYNALGQKVYSSQNVKSIDFSKYKTGLYLVVLGNDKGAFFEYKILKD